MTAASSYPLAMLIGVCKLREDAAASAMRAAERRVEEEEENGRRLRKELEDYIAWRIEEENRRYREIIGTETDREEMEKFRAGLSLLKEKDVEYEGRIIESDRRLVELREKLTEAKKAYLAAVQETTKIDAHREMWMEDWTREQNRIEDVEMEEFTGGPKPGDDENDQTGDDYDEQ